MPPSSLSPPSFSASQLLRNLPEVWSGREIARVNARSTGFQKLDSLLPGEGWPLGALTELVPAVEGIGEVALVLPALRSLCCENRQIVFVHPPHIPYAPALLRAGL